MVYDVCTKFDGNLSVTGRRCVQEDRDMMVP
jgi:hypothetical protein